MNETPHVTILRPVKGLEPNLYDCLAATFHQDYPREKLTIHLCISSRKDPAVHIVEKILEDYPDFDAQIFVEEEDPRLVEDERAKSRLGPNPKIRNMSRGYREATGDLLWILDCNVWVGRGVCGRMVDRLSGLSSRGGAQKYKFVHHLPIVVDVDENTSGKEALSLLQNGAADDAIISSSSTNAFNVENSVSTDSMLSSILRSGGGRLEELFLASSHAKMYTAINTVLVAPCIVGKSNMFRRSHLNALTDADNPGIDHFSNNICEDHLIGDLLWRMKVPEEESGASFGKHALVWGDLAIQPMAHMKVTAYFARRVRWLRVRKFTVTLATLVEPGTESFLCSAFGAFAFTTLPYFCNTLRISRTWFAFWVLWLLSVTAWACVDWTVYLLLHSGWSLEVDENTPAFARPSENLARRPFGQWLLAWIGREALALPIWIWAFYGGVTVIWREKKFWVGMDMRVHEIKDQYDKTGEGSVASKMRANGMNAGNEEKQRIE